MVVGTVRRTAKDEDLLGIFHPCPIPPNPSKRQPVVTPNAPSSKWYVYKRNIWKWITSSEFAGLCGILAVATAYLGLAISLFSAISWYIPTINYLADLGNPYHIGGPDGPFCFNPSAPFYNGCQILDGIFLLILGFHLLASQIRRVSVVGILVGLVFIMYPIMGPLSYGIFYQGFNPLDPHGHIFLINWFTSTLITLLPFLLAIAFAPIFLRQDRKTIVLFIVFVVIGVFAVYLGSFVNFWNWSTLAVLSSWVLCLAWIAIFSALFVFGSKGFTD
ncbi:MAG: hypothetical protein ACFFAL_02480 [Promethearchaeota archaeon]